MCFYTYTFHNHKNKIHREKRWFKLWITEGYSVRQLINISNHGIFKIKKIISFWLKKSPQANFSKDVKYLIFDGTYFKHENCLIAVIDNTTGKVINHKYCIRENYGISYLILDELKHNGIYPKAIVIDGNTNVIKAVKAVWSDIIVQRCLTHIQRQGLSWLRANPKIKCAKELRILILSISIIRTEKDKEEFISKFNKWEKRYGEQVISLPSTHKVFSDIKRTRSLIIHALPDMFHYLNDNNIPPTTNKIEGYFSRLKMIYRQHRGLSKINRKNYFTWYIYFKNNG